MDSISPDVPLKQCSKCLQWMSATPEFFPPRKRYPDGLEPQCKKCKKEHQQQYYQEHRNDFLQKRRSYYQQNKAKVVECNKKWQMLHKSNVNQYYKKYRETHEERYNAASSRRYYANIEHNRAVRKAYLHSERGRMANYLHYTKRRAQKRNAPGTHTVQDIHKQYQRQKGKCYYCHKKIAWGKHHVDHVFPIARGGSNGPDNLVITCPTCNMRKNDKFPWEFPEGGRLL